MVVGQNTLTTLVVDRSSKNMPIGIRTHARTRVGRAYVRHEVSTTLFTSFRRCCSKLKSMWWKTIARHCQCDSTNVPGFGAVAVVGARAARVLSGAAHLARRVLSSAGERSRVARQLAVSCSVGEVPLARRLAVPFALAIVLREAESRKRKRTGNTDGMHHNNEKKTATRRRRRWYGKQTYVSRRGKTTHTDVRCSLV